MPGAALPAVVITSPLALAARAYWDGQDAVQLGLSLNMPEAAVEAIEGLHDLAEQAPAKIRARCVARIPSLKQALSDFLLEYVR